LFLTKPSIKLAHLSDLDELTRLDETCFKMDSLAAKQYKHFIQSKTALVVTVKNADKLLASAILLFRKNSRIARLYSLAVHPPFQHRGIGKQLHASLEQYLIKHRYAEIRLEVHKNNKSAIRFYHVFQYQSFGLYKKFYADNSDALRMRKYLPAPSY
jgi:[ribosomal protein S18]-alanine N-acetyltransferase